MAIVAASTVGGYGSPTINPDGSQNVDPTSDAPATIPQFTSIVGAGQQGALSPLITNAVLNVILIEMRCIAEILNQQGPMWDLSQLRAEILEQIGAAPTAVIPPATSTTGSFGGNAGSI
jgi:hypothetical protein